MEIGLDPNNSVIKRLWCTIVCSNRWCLQCHRVFLQQLSLGIRSSIGIHGLSFSSMNIHITERVNCAGPVSAVGSVLLLNLLVRRFNSRVRHILSLVVSYWLKDEH